MEEDQNLIKTEDE